MFVSGPFYLAKGWVRITGQLDTHRALRQEFLFPGGYLTQDGMNHLSAIIVTYCYLGLRNIRYIFTLT